MPFTRLGRTVSGLGGYRPQALALRIVRISDPLLQASLFAVLDSLDSSGPNRFQDLVLRLWVDIGPPLTETWPRLQLGKDSVGNPLSLIHCVPPCRLVQPRSAFKCNLIAAIR